MQPMYYIGLDVHKRKISYCVKDGSGRIHAEGSISATRLELDHWMRSLPQPWSAAIEASCSWVGSWAFCQFTHRMSPQSQGRRKREKSLISDGTRLWSKDEPENTADSV